MFARVSMYRGDDLDQLVRGFEGVTAPLEEMDGFSLAYFLVDRAAGNAMSITVWESEEALTNSDRRADELRRQGTDTGGGSIESVARYEVALTVGTPTTAR